MIGIFVAGVICLWIWATDVNVDLSVYSFSLDFIISARWLWRHLDTVVISYCLIWNLLVCLFLLISRPLILLFIFILYFIFLLLTVGVIPFLGEWSTINSSRNARNANRRWSGNILVQIDILIILIAIIMQSCDRFQMLDHGDECWRECFCLNLGQKWKL